MRRTGYATGEIRPYFIRYDNQYQFLHPVLWAIPTDIGFCKRISMV